MRKQKQNGFTLIEIMIVLTVIGVLSAIAIPNYMDNIRRSARTAGQNYLSDLAQKQELRYQSVRTYTDVLGTNPGELPLPPSDVSKRYSNPVIDIAAAGTFTIKLSPLPSGILTTDGFLWIDSMGNQYRELPDTTKLPW